MKNSFNISSFLLYLSAAFLYIAAIICFVGTDAPYLGVIWLGLGTANIGIASYLSHKSHKNKNDPEKTENDG